MSSISSTIIDHNRPFSTKNEYKTADFPKMVDEFFLQGVHDFDIIKIKPRKGEEMYKSQTKRVGVYIPEYQYAEIKAISKFQHRSVPAQISAIIDDWMNEKCKFISPP